MTKIRAGDIVTVRIQVTEVADYSSKDHPDAQQVMGTMLPRGGQVGWLVPQEAAVTLAEQHFKIDDFIWVDQARSKKGKVLGKITAPNGQTHLWVQTEANGTMETIIVTPETRRL